MERPVVLFDGVCGLCNGTVDFIIARDPEGVFAFAPLQSETGRGFLASAGVPADDLDTIVLIEGERRYVKSTAALRILKRLPGLWPVLYGAIIVPRFFRDAMYNAVARNRYRWFGKSDSCRVPAPEIRQRFLE